MSKTKNTKGASTANADSPIIDSEATAAVVQFKTPDGGIFDREDLAIDWCKMRKMDVSKIEKLK